MEKVIDIIDLPSGKLGITYSVEERCSSSWIVTVKSSDLVWISWSWVGIAGTMTINKLGAGYINLPAINGELVPSLTSYTVEIDGYQSPTGNINQYLSQMVFTIETAENGTVLDTQTVSRFHNDDYC